MGIAAYVGVAVVGTNAANVLCEAVKICAIA